MTPNALAGSALFRGLSEMECALVINCLQADCSVCRGSRILVAKSDTVLTLLKGGAEDQDGRSLRRGAVLFLKKGQAAVLSAGAEYAAFSRGSLTAFCKNGCAAHRKLLDNALRLSILQLSEEKTRAELHDKKG